MSKATDRWSRASILRDLRRALRHLYDPDELRSNALMMLLPLVDRDGPSALQRVLIAAIEALQPDPGVSPQSNAWRTHHILLARYVQQFHQGEVAAGLTLSLRQLRRQDSLAVRTLLEYLWTTYGFQAKIAELHAAWLLRDNKTATTDPDLVTRQDELDWLASSVPTQSLYVHQLTDPLIATVVPLTKVLGVHLECKLADGLPPLAIALIPTREALLALVTAAVRSVPGGAVLVTVEPHAAQVSIEIRSSPSASDGSSIIALQPEELEIVRELIHLSGGELKVGPEVGRETQPTVAITLPVDERSVVLVVDDNRDALRLFQRYLGGTRYAFVGTPDPGQAVDLAVRAMPSVIVVDVMLPDIGGWELLARLREHPELQGIPIVVCTILPQEPLALALGAAAYLRKPVSRDQLLAALDVQLAQPCRGSG